MKYLMKFNDLLTENNNYEIKYAEDINNHIRDNDIEFFENNYIDNYIEYYDNQYIIIATMYGYTEIVKILVENFDVNQTNHLSRTAAYYTNNKPEILKLLLENGLNIESEDDYGELFFEFVDDNTLNIVKDNKEIIKYLKKQTRNKFNL